MIAGTPVDVIAEFYPALAGLDETGSLEPLRRIPTLVLTGDKDKMIPKEHSELIVERLPDAEFVVVPDAGHLVLLEKPDEVSDALSTRCCAGSPRSAGGRRPGADPGVSPPPPPRRRRRSPGRRRVAEVLPAAVGGQPPDRCEFDVRGHLAAPGGALPRAVGVVRAARRSPPAALASGIAAGPGSATSEGACRVRRAAGSARRPRRRRAGPCAGPRRPAVRADRVSAASGASGAAGRPRCEAPADGRQPVVLRARRQRIVSTDRWPVRADGVQHGRLDRMAPVGSHRRQLARGVHPRPGRLRPAPRGRCRPPAGRPAGEEGDVVDVEIEERSCRRRSSRRHAAVPPVPP